jgi:hypothetical protein
MCDISRTTREQETPQDRTFERQENLEMAVDGTIGLVRWTMRASILQYKIGELRARLLREFLSETGRNESMQLGGRGRSSVSRMMTS